MARQKSCSLRREVRKFMEMTGQGCTHHVPHQSPGTRFPRRFGACFQLYFHAGWLPAVTGVGFFCLPDCCPSCNQKWKSFSIHSHQPPYMHHCSVHQAQKEGSQQGFILVRHTFLFSNLPRNAFCSPELFTLRCLLTSRSWKPEFNKMNGVNLQTAWNGGKISYFSIAK